MTESERERLIAETKHEINNLIAAGKTAEAAKLLGEFGKDPDAIIAMFGMDSEEEERSRLENERKERKKQRVNQGVEISYSSSQIDGVVVSPLAVPVSVASYQWLYCKYGTHCSPAQRRYNRVSEER